jgi:hypothetical protein
MMLFPRCQKQASEETCFIDPVLGIFESYWSRPSNAPRGEYRPVRSTIHGRLASFSSPRRSEDWLVWQQKVHQKPGSTQSSIHLSKKFPSRKSVTFRRRILSSRTFLFQKDFWRLKLISTELVPTSFIFRRRIKRSKLA